MLSNGERYCEKHLEKAREKFEAYSRLYEQERRIFDAQYRKFYNSKEWKACRTECLAASPTCVECKKAFATDCHHVIPLRVDWEKRLDKSNIKTLCKPCHSKHELTDRNRGEK